MSSPKSDDAASASRGDSRARTQSVRLARKTQSLDILYAVATDLSQPGNLDQLLDGFLDTFIELVDARAASVRLATGDGYTRLIASRGLAPEVVERDLLMPYGRCPCGLAATAGGLRIQSGTAPCAKLIGRPMLERDCTEFVGCRAVPGPHLGVYNLFLDHPLAAMGEDARDLLISVGRHLGLAMRRRAWRAKRAAWPSSKSATSSATNCTTRSPSRPSACACS